MNLQNVQITGGKGVVHVSCKKCSAGYTFPPLQTWKKRF